jgi:hypothetical protein
MKHIYTFIFCLLGSTALFAQDFDKDLATARTAYSSGDLSSARFAMEQMLSDLDLAIGKQILTMLPSTIGPLACNVKGDNVSGGSGAGAGLFVHRNYAKDTKTASIDIINNSPMITSINAILNTPIIGGMMMTNANQKVVRIQGYKSVLTKNDNGDKTGYQLQIPLNNTLFTFVINDTDESEITSYAGNLPLSKIAQAAQ